MLGSWSRGGVWFFDVVMFCCLMLGSGLILSVF